MSLKDCVVEYYEKVLQPEVVSRELLDEVLALPSPWKEDNLYGMVAYYRTYSRYIPELKRRECWLETCLRVTEYSFSLVDKIHREAWEVRLFLINLYRMNFLPSGRTLWRGDKRNPDATANYNCSFITIDSFDKYGEMTYLLMEGAGVGFSVEEKYVKKLPLLKPNVSIEYHYKAPKEGKKFRGREASFTTKLMDDSHLLVIGDSRKGWADGFKLFFDLLTNPECDEIHINFSQVRPAGSPLRTMGGTASGHEPLMLAFRKIAWIIWRSNGALSSVDAMDIANCIAEAVVCGGVRRSAQIALGDIYDKEFISAKHNLYSSFVPDESMVKKMWDTNITSLEIDYHDSKYRWRTSRVNSNNSVMLYNTPSLTELEEVLTLSKEFGEPGLINARTALERFEGFKGVNPCAEILLDDRGLCNLGELVLPNALNDSALLRSTKVLTRHLMRITLPELFMKEWTETNHKYRLLGISLCGYVDALDSGLHPEMSLRELNEFVWEEAHAYAAQLGISVPWNCTTVKPGGTLPTLPGVSAGMHRSYAPYFYHRIRVGVDHPINLVLQGMDIDISPEVGYTDSNTPRWVYTIPCKSPTKVRQIDEPAIDQLERYKKLMIDWCDQNVSCTISVDMETEFTDVVKWIHNNLDYFVGITLFPKFDPALSPVPMPLLPYETITKEQYHDIEFSEEGFHELFSTLNNTQEDDNDETSCNKGFCPNR